MRTGLTKKQKVTEVYYNAKDPTAEVYTHDTKLMKRLLIAQHHFLYVWNCAYFDSEMPYKAIKSCRALKIYMCNLFFLFCSKLPFDFLCR